MSLVAIILPLPCIKLGLVRRNRKKIIQIINDYLYLPFFLIFILWLLLSPLHYLPMLLEIWMLGMSFGFNGSSVSLLGAAAAHIYIFEIIKTAAISKQHYPAGAIYNFSYL
jgi:hypothetical protein